MKFIFSTLKKTLFWSYDRGSWQYDLMVFVILAFVFAAPNRFFPNHDKANAKGPEYGIFITKDELGPVAPSDLESALSKRLSKLLGHPVRISRVDQVTDDSGKIIYIVYHE